MTGSPGPPERAWEAPVSEFGDLVTRRSLDLKSAGEVFRPALVAELKEHPYEFDIQVQLCADASKCPSKR